MDGKGDTKTSRTARQISKRRAPDVPTVGGTRFHDMLSPKDQNALSAIGSVDNFPTAGMQIIREGESAENLYAIASGMVRIFRHLENGGRQILAFLWPGDIFGLIDDDGLYVNSASTLSAAKIHRFPLRQLETVLLRNPRLQFHLLVRVNHNLRAAQRQIINLGQNDTYRRLASFLVELKQHEAFLEPGGGRLRLPMSRSDIADYLGTTQETVSRGFRRMEREGIVKRLSPRLLEVEDFSSLLRLAPHAPHAPIAAPV